MAELTLEKDKKLLVATLRKLKSSKIGQIIEAPAELKSLRSLGEVGLNTARRTTESFGQKVKENLKSSIYPASLFV